MFVYLSQSLFVEFVVTLYLCHIYYIFCFFWSFGVNGNSFVLLNALTLIKIFLVNYIIL